MESLSHDDAVVHLRRAGTSLVARLDGTDLPCVLHWGPDLGDVGGTELEGLLRLLRPEGPTDGIDPHSWISVAPRQTAGWIGRPGLVGSRDLDASTLTYTSVTHEIRERNGADVIRTVANDDLAGVEVTSILELLPTGLIRVRLGVRNLHPTPYTVSTAEPALPVPTEADEILDMGGRPGHERTPQRHQFLQGQWVREAWGGRPGHDSATILCAGRSGFGFRAGRVWGVHLAWSGNQVLSAESSFTGWKLLRGGELLGPREVILDDGESYESPWLYASWGEGLDELAGRFHSHLRSRPEHPTRPRPVLLNTWEAVYFDLDMEKLLALAHAAAELGVERYVLDDGWFGQRRDDSSSLGDWSVDRDRFPDGLAPLVDAVHELGMEFGLWFEPEMINLDSDLAREHPEWILATHAGPGLASRNQHVLDLANRAAWDHVLERISSLVEQYEIAYIKWDHNRALVGAGHGPEHRPGVHGQTLAVYRMMAELLARHPGLEIETCCGGGGRLDLGILEYACRAWVSDCIDSHERHRMVRWTGLTLPLEMMGTHVGSEVDHTTGRRHDLSFRAGTAIWGHLGVEWDLTRLSLEERAELRLWIALYKRFRDLLHSGRSVHADNIDPALQLDGVVHPDGAQALYRLSVLELPRKRPAGRVPLPGLQPQATYRINAVSPSSKTLPGWAQGAVVMRGKALEEIGVMAPILNPDELALFHVERVGP